MYTRSSDCSSLLHISERMTEWASVGHSARWLCCCSHCEIHLKPLDGTTVTHIEMLPPCSRIRASPRAAPVWCHANADVLFDPLVILRRHWFLCISIPSLLITHATESSAPHPSIHLVSVPLTLPSASSSTWEHWPHSHASANLKTRNNARGRREQEQASVFYLLSSGSLTSSHSSSLLANAAILQNDYKRVRTMYFGKMYDSIFFMLTWWDLWIWIFSNLFHDNFWEISHRC